MKLTLQIENFSVLDDGGPVSVVVPETGLQVGRNAGMGWVLPDASRHISGHHFDVYHQGGQWLLHDRSTNGTFLQGHRHRLDGAHRLSHGDRFQVGQYIVVVLFDAPAARPGMEPGSLPPYQVGQPAPGPAAGDDPWAMPGGHSPINPMPVQAGPRQADFAHDFVAFPAGPQGAAPAVPAPAPAQPHPPHVAAQGPAGAPFAAPHPAGAGAESSLPPAPQGVFAPAAHAAAPAAPTTAPPPAQPAAQAEPAAFVRAFCRGAGLPDDLARDVDPEALAGALGQAVAVTTARLMSALRDRSVARHFTRAAERTMRGASDNNPLKFLPSPEQAIEASFLRPRAGFMAGAQGYGDALGDLARHQAALFAALQPALAELMQDLDPGRIETEAKARAGLAGQRKARAWDAYVERWDAKAAHDNGILDEFIRLFAAAYRAADEGAGEDGGGTPPGPV
ncbi:MAG: type VI secretion system-associated FHA domain protein TagH [Paracoccus sp. (in: a-proteobacteria)]|nr:type VI secretion system-associated FHA domain protein TagH [Paracoccus sp. (in: a-proteobacteria)]